MSSRLIFDLQRFAHTTFNIATGNTVLSSSSVQIDASKVVSGTLPVARGGTGLTASPSMLTNLGTTTAANVFAASPRPGITGTLGVGNGGTGQTNLANVTGIGSALRVNRGTLTGTTADNLMYVKMADNDYFRIRVGGTASNAGWVEFATADDSNEPIYVRQYSGEFTTLTRTVTLLDASGNTSFPGTVTAAAFSGTFTGNVSSAVTASSLATARALQVSLSNTAAANFQGNADVKTIGVQGILAVANGGTGTNNLANITVGKANTLTTARALQVSLSSTGAPTFNGTADVKTIGVTGILNVANGGTGTNNLSNVAVGAATKATQDGSGNTITTTYAPLALSATQNAAHQIPYAGNTEALSNNLANFQSLKSGFYSEQLSTNAPESTSSSQWYNVISVRHRNGGTDGTKYGMLIASRMTTAGNLYWRQQLNGTWQGLKTIIDSSNIGSQTVASATTASSLVTARALQVSLSKTSSTNFQGNANVTDIGVQGTLPVANGGTGTNSLNNITVGKASSLATARNLKVSLASGNAQSFQGTGDATQIGVGGVLGTVNGGTGAAVNPSMLVNLGSTAAANVFQASPRPGITGTLGVGNGGTGQTNLANVAVGSATTATKFASAQTIALTGDITGSVSSQAGWTINTHRRGCIVGTNNTANSKPWYKVCSTTISGTNQDRNLLLLVNHQNDESMIGILRVFARYESAWAASCKLQFIYNMGFDPSKFVMVLGSDSARTVELWCSISGTAIRYNFTVLVENDNSNWDHFWTFYPVVSAGQQSSITTAGTQKVAVNKPLPVASGGTGQTTAYHRTSVGTLDWTNSSGNTDLYLQKGAIAYWNGAYSGSSSNLAYCNKGAFGSIVTCNSPLPIANGGTGQTSAAAARNALGLGNTTGALPVANGGTGQTSIANIQAGKDGNGSVISSTYLKLAGGTITGDVTLGTNSAPSHLIMPTVGAGIFSEYRDVRSGLTIIHKMDYGHDILLQGSNKAIIVAGECIQQMLDSDGNLSYLPAQGTSQTITANHNYEDIYLIADKDIFFCAGQDKGINSGDTFVGRLQATTGYLRGLNAFEGHLIDLYGTTYTAAATGEKAVTLSGMIQNDDGATRFPYGMRIAVEFRYGNTASQVTLNVNNLGAKGVMYKGSATGFTNFKALVIYEFIYNSGNWYLMGDHG